jgi:hypothetical protein
MCCACRIGKGQIQFLGDMAIGHKAIAAFHRDEQTKPQTDCILRAFLPVYSGHIRTQVATQYCATHIAL